VSAQIAQAVDRLAFRCPSILVDGIAEVDPGLRLVAHKNVTVNEDFFQGHFPGVPLMPGVLMIESLAQAATMMLLHRGDGMAHARAWLRGVDQAKFRRQVVPGDRVRLDVRLVRRRTRLARVHAEATVNGHVVAEAVLWMGIEAEQALVHPTAIVHEGAVLGAGTVVGPHAVVGPNVRIGRNCEVGASAVIDGWTEIGDDNRFFPGVSIGLAPQDLKYAGQPTRVVIGRRNVFREFVTVHRGTEGGGGVTTIADRNLFMAYAHVAHDCHVGSETIFGNAATIGGHVTVGDFATISAFSGVHQFCRIGQHAFVGGYSVVTKDAMPYAKSVGNRARIFGLNTIGLLRRGIPPDVVRKLRQAYRYLLVSKLNTTRALAEIEQDASIACDEVRSVVEFVRTAKRGVTLKRGGRRSEDVGED